MDKAAEIARLEEFFKTTPILLKTAWLGPGIEITDIPKFIDSHLARAKRQLESRLREPVIERLQKLEQEIRKQTTAPAPGIH
jgi:hypothetical protein